MAPSTPLPFSPGKQIWHRPELLVLGWWRPLTVPRPTVTIVWDLQAEIPNPCCWFFSVILSGDRLFFIFRFSVAQALKIFFGFPFGYFSLITCSFNSFRNFAFYNYTRLQNIWRSNIWLVFLKSFFFLPSD